MVIVRWISQLLSFGVFAVVYTVTSVVLGVIFPVRVSNSRVVPKTGPLLVLANHQSYLDPILIGLSTQRRAGYVARASLFKIPGFGWLISALGAIKLEREKVAVEGIRASRDHLRAGGMIALWPEGTRTLDGEIQPLKPGVLLLLRQARTPVVIAGIAGSFESWPRSRPIPFPHPIWIHYETWNVPEKVQSESLEELAKNLQNAFEEAKKRLAILQAQ